MNNHIASVSVGRHGKTSYTGIGRDLTECAIPDIKAAIDSILYCYPNRPITFLSSPKERAIGTVEVLQEILIERGVEFGSVIDVRDGFRALDIPDRPKIDVIVKRVLKGIAGIDERIRIFDSYYARAPEFDSPEHAASWELRSAAQKRFIKNLLLLTQEIRDSGNHLLHRVLITHFELLNGNLVEWFGLDGEKKGFLKPAEVAHFDFFSNKSGSSLETNVLFRGEEKIIQLGK